MTMMVGVFWQAIQEIILKSTKLVTQPELIIKDGRIFEKL